MAQPDYIPDQKFADSFLCNSDQNFHDSIYISPNYAKTSSLLYCINRVGITSAVPQVFHVKRNANFKCSHIFCITGGSGVLKVDGREYALEKNTIAVLSDISAHEYYSSPDDPMGLTWLEFYGSDSSRLVTQMLREHGHIFHGDIFLVIESKIKALLKLALQSRMEHFSRNIYDILMDLYDDAQAFLRKNVSPALYGDFLPLSQYIENHLNEKLCVDDLSARVGYSGSHFAKLFKQVFGVPPYEYILQKKITAAKYLLTCTAMSLEEIAVSIGFCDASHFIKRFVQYETIAPTEYRRAFRSSADT